MMCGFMVGKLNIFSYFVFFGITSNDLGNKRENDLKSFLNRACPFT